MDMRNCQQRDDRISVTRYRKESKRDITPPSQPCAGKLVRRTEA